jgi:single-strand DNA-binding protein
METLVGRVTADAKVVTLKDDKKVVNFSIAINDSFKSKSSSEVKKVVRFVQCAYWINTSIAKYLTKGTLVEVYGRINIGVWNNLKGEAKGSLRLHVNSIKLHGKGNPQNVNNETQETTKSPVSDDLPF